MTPTPPTIAECIAEAIDQWAIEMALAIDECLATGSPLPDEFLEIDADAVIGIPRAVARVRKVRRHLRDLYREMHCMGVGDARIPTTGTTLDRRAR